jgi:uncharacterized Rmd1/YagE family protein
MRCVFYCTAAEYKMELLAKYFEKQSIEYKYFDDVIYAQLYDSKVDSFIFPFGCVVFWGEDENHKNLLKELRKFEIEHTTEEISDFVHFSYRKKAKEDDLSNSFIEEEDNRIILGSKSEYLKLSISHALAQSVKLSQLESTVSKMLDSTTLIQKELARTGRVSLSQKEISKKIGKLFSERFSVSLHSDILDTPEFFWRRPSYEPLYLKAAEFQDISVRHGILNHRLDIIQELYTILSNELQNRHSSNLEIVIIVLITMEVVLALFHNNILTKIWNLFGM